jgi:uncharacterized LabA/DUF88 family protein
MEENWAAFYIAIQLPVSPEQAFNLYWNGREKKLCNRELTEADTKEMIKLKETMTYKQIAERYGISDRAVIERMRYYYKKNKDVYKVKRKACEGYTDNYYYTEGNSFITLHRIKGSRIVYQRMLRFKSRKAAAKCFNEICEE